eukprot:TRINITY_DN3151_c0_g1_i1.p1 TRINITY_DN3151_c0_g1~~TRINITY_DN3151_c0_g1_i1.p1  ORF type:complete len:1008 (-),score=159.34 TRINITY_DN3151_c0_g1_i1:238-3261(-)
MVASKRSSILKPHRHDLNDDDLLHRGEKFACKAVRHANFDCNVLHDRSNIWMTIDTGQENKRLSTQNSQARSANQCIRTGKVSEEVDSTRDWQLDSVLCKRKSSYSSVRSNARPGDETAAGWHPTEGLQYYLEKAVENHESSLQASGSDNAKEARGPIWYLKYRMILDMAESCIMSFGWKHSFRRAHRLLATAALILLFATILLILFNGLTGLHGAPINTKQDSPCENGGHCVTELVAAQNVSFMNRQHDATQITSPVHNTSLTGQVDEAKHVTTNSHGFQNEEPHGRAESGEDNKQYVSAHIISDQQYEEGKHPKRVHAHWAIVKRTLASHSADDPAPTVEPPVDSEEVDLPGRETRQSTKAHGKFVDAMRRGWAVSPLSDVPGVFLLQQSTDYACVLLVENACYLYMGGKSPMHGHHAGVWFGLEPEKATDGASSQLAGPSRMKDNAGGKKQENSVADADAVTVPKWTSRRLLQSEGTTKPSEGETVVLNGRDLSQIDLSRDVCRLFQIQNKVDHLLDMHDLTDLRIKENSTYGHFVSPSQLQDYVRLSSRTSRKSFVKMLARAKILEERNPGSFLRNVGVVTRFDSHVGHFGEIVVPLAEAAKHMIEQETGASLHAKEQLHEDDSSSKGLPLSSEFTLFFPSDKNLSSNWTTGIGQLLFGPGMKALAGRREGVPMCFRNVAFILNARSTSESAEDLKQKARDWLTNHHRDGSKGLQVDNEKSSVGSNMIVRSENSAGPEEDEMKGEEERTVDQQGQPAVRWLRKLAGVGIHIYHRKPNDNHQTMPYEESEGRLQITVVEREGTRLVANLEDVARLLVEEFPSLPVAIIRMHALPLEQQIAFMQRTVMLVGMHGSSLSNVVFMKKGSIVLEVFPFNFFSHKFERVAIQAGVQHFSWQNLHLSNSSYPNNCINKPLSQNFKENNGQHTVPYREDAIMNANGGTNDSEQQVSASFASLTRKQCWQIRECLFCVRDRSVTTVNLAELRNLLLRVSPLVNEQLFLESKA